MSGQRRRFGPFEIDSGARVLLRDGEPLPVGPRGVRLLETLLSRPGEVLTKRELMDAVWGSSALEESNLSVQVAGLRKALGAGPDGGDWIATVPRVGYRLVPPGRSSGGRSRPAPRSIAVLPFVPLGTDHDQRFLADGLAEDVLTSLNKVAGLLVIARSSSFAYRDRDVDVREVGEDLGVQLVLTGSVRQDSGRVRISAQLADCATGSQIWAERYDRELSGLFALQDEVSRHIVEALQLELDPAAPVAPREGGTRNRLARDLVQQAKLIKEGSIKTAASFLRQRELLEHAIAQDPGYADAYAGLGEALILDYLNRWTADPDSSLQQALALSQRAIELAPRSAAAHLSRSLATSMSGDIAESDHELDIAAEIEPNHPSVIDRRANQEMRRGNPAAAIPLFERALRLDPLATIHFLQMLGSAYFHLDRFETAAELFRERIALVPETDISRSLLIACLGHLGRPEEAAAIHAELMTVNPRYDLTAHFGRLPANAAPGYLERASEGWRRAGLL